MAEQEKDTLATLPGPRDTSEVPPEHDTDAEHAEHGDGSWVLLGYYSPEQDFEWDGKKAVARGAVTEPVAKYICTAETSLGTTCGVVKEEPWEA